MSGARSRTAASSSSQSLDFGRCRLAIGGAGRIPVPGPAESLAGQAHRHHLSEHPRRFLRERRFAGGRDRDPVRARSRSPRASAAPTSSATWFPPAPRSRPTICGKSTTVMESQAALIRTPVPLSGKARLDPPAVAAHRRRGAGSREQVHHAARAHARAGRDHSILPGSESPTVIPLDGPGDKVAVHAVCRENVFWETLERLKAAGASAVLVLPVEKMLA